MRWSGKAAGKELKQIPLPTAEAEQTRLKANEQLLIALERRGANVLDVLVECLKEEKDANKDLIETIRKGAVFRNLAQLAFWFVISVCIMYV